MYTAYDLDTSMEIGGIPFQVISMTDTIQPNLEHIYYADFFFSFRSLFFFVSTLFATIFGYSYYDTRHGLSIVSR